MKKLFTLLVLCAASFSLFAAEGDTLYYEDFEVDDLMTETPWMFVPDWIGWNEAYVTDTAQLCGEKSMVIVAPKGTFAEFFDGDGNLILASWTFNPDGWYKYQIRYKSDSARSLDITRLPEGSVAYHKDEIIDAIDNNGEWVIQMNSVEGLLDFNGEWTEIVVYLNYGTGTPNPKGPTFGMGWGGGSNILIDALLVTESTEDAMDTETEWAKTLTGCPGEDVTSVFKRQVNAASIYPNPSSGQVYISSKTEVQEVEVYSITGMLVKAAKGDNITSIDVSDLSIGMYSVVVKSNNVKSTSKLVVE